MRDLAQASWAFPLVGLVVGAAAGGALWLADAADLHPLACALIGLAVQVLVTGALHEDGLADVADGLGGGRNRARALEIMRDSRIGSFGVLALVFGVGIRAALIAGIPSVGWAWLSIIAAAAASRAVMPVLMHLMPPARTDGLSRSAGRPSARVAGTAVLLGAAALIALLPLKAAVIAAGLAVLAAACVGGLASRRFGGQTGDVLGAAQQAAEIAVLVAAAGWIRGML